MNELHNELQTVNHQSARTIVGKLSGKKITIPDVNVPPMPAIASPDAGNCR